MHNTFGARLRQQREKREISLKTVSEQTKIKLSLLEGLERDDISHWPSGIFRRAYLRTYASAIGLNPDVVAREFFELHPEPVEPVEPPAPPQPRLRSFVGSALGSLSLRRKPARNEPQWRPQGFAVNLPPEEPPEPLFDSEPAVEPPPAGPGTAPELDILAAAQLCTDLGRVEDPSQVQPLLREAARILDARGLVVWVWDAIAAELRPALVHGYSECVRSKLPCVKADANNVTAAAFRSEQTCAINGDDRTGGALVVPLLTPAACAGVLAIELPYGSAQATTVRAVATFIAAMLAQLVGVATDDEPLPAAPVEAEQHA